eukprot:5994042-Amphidinium_carterae.1
MERGCAVGTAGVRTVDDKASSDDYIGEENHRVYRSVCGRLHFASPRRPDILFTLKTTTKPLSANEAFDE